MFSLNFLNPLLLHSFMSLEKYALLLAGPEPRFKASCSKVKRHMVKNAGFSKDNIQQVNCVKSADLLDSTHEFFKQLNLQAPSAPIVVYYDGHGVREGFDVGSVARYDEWVTSVAHPGPIFLMLHMCHAGSIVRHLKRSLSFDPQKDGLLASSRASEYSWSPYFTDESLDAFSAGVPYQKKQVDIPPFHGLRVEAASWKSDGTGVILACCIGGINLPQRIVHPSKVPKDLQSPYRVVFYPDRNLELGAVAQVRTSLEVIQHPVRFGATLDYLLFKQ